MTRKEERDVYKANEAFYNAFESRDIKEMEKIWADKDQVQCIHPGWGVLRGRESVMASWRRIFERSEEILFMLAEIRIEIQGSLAWVTLYENITTTRAGEEVVTGVVLATNIFEKHNGRWLIIHHHGSTVAQPPNQVNPSTFH